MADPATSAYRSGDELVDRLISSPGGAALLARLEMDQRSDLAPFEVSASSDPEAVARAVRWVADHSFGELTERIVNAMNSIAGPWTSDAPRQVAACIRLACEREPIAIEVVRRFKTDLNRSVDLGGQEWWMSAPQSTDGQGRARFVNFGPAYGGGEFPWAGLWTVTDPPVEPHDTLVSAWEIFPGPSPDGAFRFEPTPGSGRSADRKNGPDSSARIRHRHNTSTADGSCPAPTRTSTRSAN